MRIIAKPLGATAAVAIVIFLLNFTNYAPIVNFIGLTFLLILLALFIHELGHVISGICSGYRFNYLTIGPISIENSNRLRIKRNDSWFLFGGVASCSPLSSDLSAIAKQHKRFVAGGPVFSIMAAMIGMIVGMYTEKEWMTHFGIFNALIFLATILPYRGAIKSDGRVLLELTKGGKQTEEFLISLLLIKEMNSPAHPADWSEAYIQQARTLKPTADNVMVGYILFYYALIKEGYEHASALLEPFKQLPVTKQNRYTLHFITHIRQIDLIVEGKYDEPRLSELHQLLNPFEPIGYKRSEAILAAVKGDRQIAKLKLTEAFKEIDKTKNSFGFLYAEEKLTHILKNKILETA